MFECVAKKTPVIATEREALLIYKDKIDISFFADINGLISSINSLLKPKEKDFDTSQFDPDKYWAETLSILP